MVFNCAVENSYDPMRFAGTWKQYSKKAIPHLTKITFHKASLRYFKCPYQANVIKILETVNSSMVRTSVALPHKGLVFHFRRPQVIEFYRSSRDCDAHTKGVCSLHLEKCHPLSTASHDRSEDYPVLHIKRSNLDLVSILQV